MRLLFQFLLTVLTVQISSYAFAGDEDVVIVKESPADSVVENSSAHNRMNKKYSLTVMPIGFGPLNGIDSEINVGYFLDRKSIVSVRYNNLVKGNTCTGSLSCSDSGKAYGVSYKRFFGNSFYVNTAIDQREISYSETQSDLGAGNYWFNFKGSSTIFSVVVGNQWQWKSFTLGCDWAGLGVPLAHQITNENDSGDNAWSASNRSDRESMYVSGSVAIALRFYLGASF